MRAQGHPKRDLISQQRRLQARDLIKSIEVLAVEAEGLGGSALGEARGHDVGARVGTLVEDRVARVRGAHGRAVGALAVKALAKARVPKVDDDGACGRQRKG